MFPVFKKIRLAALAFGLVAFVSIPPSLHACDKAPGRKVVDALLSLDLATAETELAQWRSRDANDPMLGFYEALKTLSVGYIESGHDQSFRVQLWGRALKQLKRVVKKTESAVDAGSATPRQRLAYGMAQSFSSVLHTLRKEMVRSYRAGSKGREVLDSLVAEHPELADPYLVLGLFEYHVGILPDEDKWKTKLLGLDGDAQVGVSYLEQAIENAPATGPEAARVLLMDLELAEEQQCRYRSLARLMRDTYPTNKLFPVYARVYDLQCRIAEREGRPVAADMPIHLNAGCI